MTQLDGVGFFESMQDQEEDTIKEQRKETIIRQMAKDNKTGIAEAKATAPAKRRTPEFFNIGHDDAHVQTDEAEVAQGIEQSNIHTKARKGQNKDRAKTHIIKIRTVEHDVMKPGTAEMGTSTNPTATKPIETQTSATSSASNATQTFPLHAMDTTGNKKQAKQIVKDDKLKKERKQRGLAKVLERDLKADAMHIDPEPPQTEAERVNAHTATAAEMQALNKTVKTFGNPPRRCTFTES